MASTNFVASTTGAQTGRVDAGVGKTFRQFSLKTLSSVSNAVVALETSPDNTTYTEVCRVSGASGWGYARSDHVQRYARINVISLGTGTPPVSACVNYYS